VTSLEGWLICGGRSGTSALKQIVSGWTQCDKRWRSCHSERLFWFYRFVSFHVVAWLVTLMFAIVCWPVQDSAH
jgi:hypothetical protein